MPDWKIKIFGERNTGTRYIERLVDRNLEAEVLAGSAPAILGRALVAREMARDLFFRATYRTNLGWKHAIAPRREQIDGIDLERVVFVSVTKNPYSWLLSMHRNPYHSERREESFRQFLLTPWNTVGRENHPQPFADPVRMWNEKNRSYLQLADFASAVNVRYEDVLEDPESRIRRIGDTFGVPHRQEAFSNLSESTKEKSKNFDYYRRYYLEEQWREKYDAALVEIVNERLDHELAASLGYERLVGNV